MVVVSMSTLLTVLLSEIISIYFQGGAEVGVRHAQGAENRDLHRDELLLHDQDHHHDHGLHHHHLPHCSYADTDSNQLDLSPSADTKK